ncbi:hypothetical protein ACFQZ4_20125 [Catellatospora coxensis]
MRFFQPPSSGSVPRYRSRWMLSASSHIGSGVDEIRVRTRSALVKWIRSMGSPG